MCAATQLSLTPDNAATVVDKDWTTIVVTKSDAYPQAITLRKLITGLYNTTPPVSFEGVVFAELDVDRHPTTAAIIGINRESGIYAFRDGDLVDKSAGDVRVSTAVRWAQRVIG